MKNQSSPLNSLVAVICGAVLIVCVGAVVWLSNSHMMPVTQKTELTVPDERIPR